QEVEIEPFEPEVTSQADFALGKSLTYDFGIEFVNAPIVVPILEYIIAIGIDSLIDPADHLSQGFAFLHPDHIPGKGGGEAPNFADPILDIPHGQGNDLGTVGGIVQVGGPAEILGLDGLKAQPQFKALALEFSGIEDRGGEEIGGNRYVQGDQGVRGLSVVIVQGTGQSGVEHPEIKAQVNFALGLPF